jgi:hypothetical protein
MHGNQGYFIAMVERTTVRRPRVDPCGGVNVLSAVRGSTKHAGGRKTSWSAIRRRGDS